MNDKTNNLLPLIIGLALASAAKRAGEEMRDEMKARMPFPDLDTMLSGARQKGTPIFTTSNPDGEESIFKKLFEQARNPKFEAPINLLDILLNDKPWEVPAIRDRARGDILIGKLKPNGDCDCEFCEWVREQIIEMGVGDDGPDLSEAAARAEAAVADFCNEVASPSVTGHWEVQRRAATVPEILRSGADTYEQRNAQYGDSYKVYGAVMKAMFPDGLPDMATTADFNRLGVFNMIVSKITRYASSLGNGGHFDSALDLSVYGAMLAELTEEK